MAAHLLSELSFSITAEEGTGHVEDARGVPVTPARMPDSKSRRTRAATASERRSASKRSRSRPEALDPLPEMRVVDAAAVGVERVDHLEEARPGGPAASAAACSAGERGCLLATGKWRKTSRRRALAQLAARRRRSAGSRGRRRRSAPPPPRRDVVVRPDRRDRRHCSRSAHGASRTSASKIRLAPGNSPRRRRFVGPGDLAVLVDEDEGAVGEADLLDVGAVGAGDLALGLEVGEQRRVDAELLLEGLVGEEAVDADPDQLDALRLRSPA